MERLSSLLYKIDPDIPYGEWIRTLAAIYYETEGSEHGFKLADKWSSGGVKYRGSREIRTKWRSFSLTGKRTVTAGTLVWIAKNIKVSKPPYMPKI